MKIICYVRETIISILCVLLLVFITNLFLFLSIPLGTAIGDIIYLNILLVSTAAIFWVIGYEGFRRKYLKLRQALDKKESTDHLLPQDKGLYSSLLRETVGAKEGEYIKIIIDYRKEMDELNDYITKWVHEIKIPISVCDLIIENSNLDKKEASKKLKLELERTKFLINQVLYAGRAAYYNENLIIAEFSLGKAVKEAVKHNAQFFMMKNIEVTLGFLDYEIANDEKWIAYILDQILNNASKYTLQDGKVEIDTEQEERSIKLHIRDNGVGIPAHDIQRIFDKGFSGDNGRKTAKSTGMGMYYSKKMADKLGIGLEVFSISGEYTEFILVFYKVRDYFKGIV